MAGNVLLVGAGADPGRVRDLSEHIAVRGFDVIIAQQFHDVSFEESLEAVAVVLAVGSSALPELTYPLDTDARLGRIITVRLESEAEDLKSVTQSTIDLSSWRSGGHPELDRLINILHSLADYEIKHDDSYNNNTYAIDEARSSVAELTQLTAEIGSLGEILTDDAFHTSQLRAAMKEVGNTYQVVQTALERFEAAAVDPTSLDRKEFVRLGRGFLAKAIVNGRGHCGRIRTQYRKVGGLRDAVKGRVSPDLLEKMDMTFDRLGTADGDLFVAMDELGRALNREARTIVRLLITGRDDLAREHVAEASEHLEELDQQLGDALAAFQTIEGKLGYAEPVVEEGQVVSLSVQTINIQGDVVSSNIVAANTIKQSSVSVAPASIDPELKLTLLDLHKAVARLTTHLPDDEAERAALDLKELSEEAKRSEPRRAFWQRAADGLMAAAKTASGVGVPVIDLVTKIVALI